MTISDVKVFPEAIEGVKFPELNTRIRIAENLVGLDIEEKLGKFTSKTFSLSDTTDFNSIKLFYDEDLKAKGFTNMLEKPVKSSDSQILYYEKKGFISSERIAVVFTEIENYETNKVYPFLSIFISK